MPMDRSKYPPDWESISLRIRERADWQCEACGAPNGVEVERCDRGWGDDRQWFSHDGQPIPEPPPHMRRWPVRIVLTVSHQDHDTTNNADDNLKALCQRCHFVFDAALHARHAAETRRRKQFAAGQLSMAVPHAG